MEVFIGGLPRSIEGNVTTSKPQTLKEAITITHRLMDQDLALSSVRLVTRWVIRPGTAKTKGQLLEATCSQIIHHQTHPIGQSHEKNDTLDDEKAQERWDFTLFTLSKEAQAVSITDCQAGNPCEI
ncbi:hypothetical protein Tco_0668786 [Tanacetum coccineum]